MTRRSFISIRPAGNLATLCLIGGCLLLVGADSWRSLQERQLALQTARAESDALASSVAEQAEGIFLATDDALVGLVERVEVDGTSPAALPRLKRAMAVKTAIIPTMEGFYVYDAAGNVRASLDAPGTRPYTVADRDYFIFLRDHKDRRVQVGLPLRSRGSGRWMVPLTRRVENPDGSFAGLVLGAVDIERMEALYSKIHIGRLGAIALFNMQGQLLMRAPHNAAILGRTWSNWGTLRAALQKSPEGTVELRSGFDGVERVVGYRRLNNYPVFVEVGLGREEALAQWWRNARLHLLGVLALAMAAGTLGFLLLRAARRQQQADLMAAELGSDYRLLAENATDVIMRVNANLRRAYVSPAIFPLLGYTPAEYARLAVGQNVHPDDAPMVLAAKWRAAIIRGDAISTTYRLRHRDGHYIWVEVNGRSLPGAAPGALPQAVLVMRDITERERAAGELNQALQTLQRAEHIAHIGHWRLDAQTRALTWSSEVYRIYGVAPGAAPSLDSILNLYHPDDQPAVRETVAHALATAAPYASSLRIMRPDGGLRHLAVRAEPELGPDGKLVALVGVVQDVTESREMEMMLHQRQKMEAIGQLAAGVAHDFNNMLQSVLGNLEFIMDCAPENSEIQTSARAATGSAQRGAALTHQLLSFARKQVLFPRPVRLAGLIQDLHSLLSRTLGKHIALVLDVPDGVPDVFADPNHLQTALLNLAINAGHAMESGGRLRISVATEAASGEADQANVVPNVVISVQDTGIGMAPAVLARAMEPFFTTKGPAGTGLGLSMVQGFARQSGGDLRLFSTPGMGTRAELLLPSCAPAVVEAATVAPRLPAATGRVLLVDDVPDVLMTVCRFLEHSGFTVTSVPDGDAALAILAAGGRFDVLVADYAMPGLSGVDLVMLAREMQPDLPAVLITGFAAVDTSRLADVATVLRKPFSREQLAGLVRHAMVEQAERGQAERVHLPPVGSVVSRQSLDLNFTDE